MANLFSKSQKSIVVSVTDYPQKPRKNADLTVILPISDELAADSEGLISYFETRVTEFFKETVLRAP